MLHQGLTSKLADPVKEKNRNHGGCGFLSGLCAKGGYVVRAMCASAMDPGGGDQPTSENHTDFVGGFVFFARISEQAQPLSKKKPQPWRLRFSFLLVREGGLEPPRPYGH